MKKYNLSNIATQEFIIQPTSLCNINCRYCYLPNRMSTKQISTSTLSHIFSAIFSSSFISSRANIVWHAGEPMLLPIHFYEEAIQLIEQYNKNKIHVSFTIQTNGTRITQEWCDFFKHYNVKISISLDGPQFIHDANRVDRAGKGTFKRVMQGINLLQNNDIHPGILMVLTQQALDYPDDIWQFFIEHQLMNVGFLIEEALGGIKEIPLDKEDDTSKYIKFLKRILELRDSCEHAPFVREVEDLMAHIKYMTQPILAAANVPMGILSFDCDGNISTFSPELLTLRHPHYHNFILGNVFKNSLEDIITNSKFIEMNSEIQSGVSKCEQTCEYFAFCGGGSPANKLSENGTFNSAETAHCKLKIQVTTNTILKHLEQKKGFITI